LKSCEICNKNYHHKHHIESKSFQGSNKKFNIAYLCASCHTEVHLGNIIIEGRFLTTEGYKLIFHLKGENSITGQESEKVFVMNKK
jgi:hypothetical protein